MLWSLTFILTPKLYRTVLGILSAVVVLTVVCEQRKLEQDDKLFCSCQPFLTTCCLLKCLQVTLWACVSTKAVNCHSSTLCCPGNCLSQSIVLLSNNLPLLHFCLSFNRTSILYSFNCRCLICFPVDRSEVQTWSRNNYFRTVLLFSCDTLTWYFLVMRCFRSCLVQNPVDQSQPKWTLVVTDPMASVGM